MKSIKTNKKILIASLGLATVVGCSAPFLVSCSSSATPIQVINSKIGTYTFEIGNAVKVTPGIEFDGETFTSLPKFDPKKASVQRATAFFEISGAFSQWLYGAGNSIATLISRLPTSKNHTNPITHAKITENGLDYALASYLNSGQATYRLGLKYVNATINLKNDIETNLIPYVEPTSANKDNPNVIKVKDASNPDADKPQPLTLNFSDISLTFQWWRSKNPPTIEWIGDQAKLEKQSKSDFMLNAPSGVTPLFEYTLQLNNISAKINQYSLSTIDNEKYWVPRGTWRIAEENGSPFAFNNDYQLTSDMFKYIDEANKVAAGDVVNQNFVNFINNNTNGKKINENLSLIIK